MLAATIIITADRSPLFLIPLSDLPSPVSLALLIRDARSTAAAAVAIDPVDRKSNPIREAGYHQRRPQKFILKHSI